MRYTILDSISQNYGNTLVIGLGDSCCLLGKSSSSFHIENQHTWPLVQSVGRVWDEPMT